MLSKPHRIPSIFIRTVMRTGKRVFVDSLQCSIMAQGSGLWRCATVVSVSVDKRAVVRNRIKRLISESMRTLRPELPSGTDVVFVVKKGFLYESQQQADTQVHSVLHKAGLPY